jgi:hypothetical protein
MITAHWIAGLAAGAAVAALISSARAAPPGLYQMRVYYAPEGKLDQLHARFRDHTLALFAKHGMTNLVYWHLAPGSPQSDRMLVYLLGHASREAAEKSFADFRVDADWIKSRAASEARAGGSLTEPQGGVLSEFLVPTDYSPWR